jgi:hypothetical protein
MGLSERLKHAYRVFDHSDLKLVTPYSAREVVKGASQHFEFKDGKVPVFEGYTSVNELREFVSEGLDPDRKFYVIIDERHVLQEEDAK